MDRTRWKEVERLFRRAIELEEREREPYLAANTGDEALLEEVLSLLRADARGGASTGVPKADLRFEPRSAHAGQAAADGDQEHPRVPESLGTYRILGEAGRGGMSTVYLAERDDDGYTRRVAIKVIHGHLDSDALRERFRIERHVLAQLEHPNIARLYDSSTDESGAPFLVMQYIEGEPIDAYCEAHDPPLGERLRLFRKVCEAVAYAHRNLVVHRDIKPANILVGKNGEPMLLDFGIAKLLPLEGTDLTVTQIGHRALTPSFASPEQIQGHAMTTASDVYSLGAVLYRLLTGTLPAADNLTDRLQEILEQTQPRPPSSVVGSARVSGLGGDLDAIVLKALRPEPEERYLSVPALVADLDRYAGGWPVQARRGSIGYRFGKFARRRRRALAGGLLVALAATVAVWNTLYQSRRVTGERDKLRKVSDYMVDVFQVSHPDEEIGGSVAARQLLDSAARRIADSFAGDPEAEAEVLDTMGRVYSNLGLYEEATDLFTRSLDTRETIADATGRARTLLYWADAKSGAGDPTQAIARIDEAIALVEDRDRSGALLTELLTLRGKSHDRAGLPVEAERDLKSALEVSAQTDGIDELVRIEPLVLLAQNLGQSGKPEEATPLASEALEIQRRELGRHHPDTAITLGIFADLERRSLRHDRAVELYREAIAMSSRFLPRDHPSIMGLLNRLSITLADTGDYESSLGVSKDLLELARGRLEPDHPDLANYVNSAAVSLSRLGRYSEAEPLLREALELRQRLFPGANVWVAQSNYSLGVLLLETRRPVEAEPHFLTAIRMSAAHDLPEAALPRMDYARCLAAQARHEEAERFARDALERLRGSYTSRHVRVGRAESVLGEILLAVGRIDEARPLLESGYETLRAISGDENHSTRLAKARLDLLADSRIPADE